MCAQEKNELARHARTAGQTGAGEVDSNATRNRFDQNKLKNTSLQHTLEHLQSILASDAARRARLGLCGSELRP